MRVGVFVGVCEGVRVGVSEGVTDKVTVGLGVMACVGAVVAVAGKVAVSDGMSVGVNVSVWVSDSSVTGCCVGGWAVLSGDRPLVRISMAAKATINRVAAASVRRGVRIPKGLRLGGAERADCASACMTFALTRARAIGEAAGLARCTA